MQIVLIALLALSGVGQTMQDALNAQLRNAVKSPLLGALISLLVGAVVLGLLTVFGVLGRGKPSALTLGIPIRPIVTA